MLFHKTMPFQNFNKEWALLTSGTIKDFNQMPIHWGLMGTLWNKDVVVICVEETSYTLEFIRDTKSFTVTFFDEEYKPDLKYLGLNSGRDVKNKIYLTNLHPTFNQNKYLSYKEAHTTFACTCLYIHEIDDSQLPNVIRDKYYKKRIKHIIIIGEVVDLFYAFS